MLIIQYSRRIDYLSFFFLFEPAAILSSYFNSHKNISKLALEEERKDKHDHHNGFNYFHLLIYNIETGWGESMNEEENTERI